MGYSTEFRGRFNLDRELDDETYDLLKGLSETRRMKRNVDEKIYGPEGEFYFEGCIGGYNINDDTIIDQNTPPVGQPDLWCDWTPTEDKKGLQWNGSEKFYNYVDWLKYIIKRVLMPRGYTLSGIVEWRGEEFGDDGMIIVADNVVSTQRR